MKDSKKTKIKKTSSEKKDRVHFIEDLEKRRNTSGPVTTLALGEEDGGGW